MPLRAVDSCLLLDCLWDLIRKELEDDSAK